MNLHCFSFDLTYCQIKSQRREEVKRRDLKGCSRPDRCGCETGAQGLLFIIFTVAAAAAKLLQSCRTLSNPIDGSPPGSPVPGILQARTLEQVAISFSNAWKWRVKVKLFSHVQLLATPWTVAYQAPPSTGFSRQEYWSDLPLPSPLLSFSLKTIFLS